MENSSTVMGIDRFLSRPGVPSVIRSDNGRNFFATKKELLNNILNSNQQVLTKTLAKKCNRYKFNPPIAPHRGSVWERLVRSFKHVFQAVFENRRLSVEILTTKFCLVEQSLNAHPLVPASADATELDVLIPKHFLVGIAGSSLPSKSSTNRPKKRLRACASVLRRHLKSVFEGVRSKKQETVVE